MAFTRSIVNQVLIGCFLAICALAAILVWHRNTAEVNPPSVPVIRMGYRPRALADVTPVIIKEAGLVSESVSVELIPVSSPGDGWQKFAAREIDVIAGMPLESVLQQLVGGQPSRPFVAYYFQVDVQGEGWVSLIGSKSAGVQAIADLAGKPVGSLPTTQAQYLLHRILLASGLSESDIQIVTYNPANPLLGIRSGQHAALFGLEPAISLALEEGGVLLTRGPISAMLYNGKPVPVSASVIAQDFLARHSTAAQAFDGLVNQAVQIVHDRPQAVRSYFEKAEHGGLSSSVAQRLFLPVMAKPSGSLRATLETYVADLIRDKQLDRNVDVSTLFSRGVAE